MRAPSQARGAVLRRVVLCVAFTRTLLTAAAGAPQPQSRAGRAGTPRSSDTKGSTEARSRPAQGTGRLGGDRAGCSVWIARDAWQLFQRSKSQSFLHKLALELICRYSLTHTRVCGSSCSEAQALHTGSASVLVSTTHLKPKHLRVLSCTRPQGFQEGDWASTGFSQLTSKISKKGLLVLLRSAAPDTKKDRCFKGRMRSGVYSEGTLGLWRVVPQDHPDSAQRRARVGHWHLDPGRCAHIPATGWRRRWTETWNL